MLAYRDHYVAVERKVHRRQRRAMRKRIAISGAEEAMVAVRIQLGALARRPVDAEAVRGRRLVRQVVVVLLAPDVDVVAHKIGRGDCEIDADVGDEGEVAAFPAVRGRAGAAEDLRSERRQILME